MWAARRRLSRLSSSPSGLTRQSTRPGEDIVPPMRTERVDAWRGPAPGRPELPLPPGRMPPLRGGRPLKRWRWVGAFGPDAMACAARVSIGGVPVMWWAAWDGAGLHEGKRGVRVGPGRASAPGLELRFEEGDGVEVVSPHGDQHIWTRKQGGIPVRGTLLGRPFEGR